MSRFAVGLLAMLLLLMNVGGWGLLWHSWKTQRELLEQSLQTSAALIASAMTPDSLFFLAVSYDPESAATDFNTLQQYVSLPSALALQQSLADASGRHADLDIAILSNSGDLVSSTDGIATQAVPDQWAAQDAELIATATGGEVAANIGLQPARVRRVYYPLHDEVGQVIGLLRLASSQPTPMPFRRLARRLLFFSLFSTGLILFLWWNLNRLIKRSIAAERMAYQSDRLRALGTATAGIAHEIRNPLGIIILSIEELRAGVKEVGDEKVRSSLLGIITDLQEETSRLRELTDQFLNFSRDKSGTIRRTKIDLADSVEKTVKLFQKGAPMNLSVVFRNNQGPLIVWFGEARLRQVLLNVMRNAQEAFAGKDGRIDITVSRDGMLGTVEIKDNGPGMDAATLSQAFDPFFTTRAEGTGLGLSLSKTLVEAAGGQLVLESEILKGTTVRLVFPAAPDEAR